MQINSGGILSFLCALAFKFNKFLITNHITKQNSSAPYVYIFEPGISAVGFGFAFSTVMIGRLLFQLPLGHYSDKIGRRQLRLPGLLAMGISTAFLGVVTTYVELIIVHFMQGVAAAGLAGPAFAVVADLSKTGGEGREQRSGL